MNATLERNRFKSSHVLQELLNRFSAHLIHFDVHVPAQMGESLSEGCLAELADQLVLMLSFPNVKLLDVKTLQSYQVGHKFGKRIY